MLIKVKSIVQLKNLIKSYEKDRNIGNAHPSTAAEIIRHKLSKSRLFAAGNNVLNKNPSVNQKL